MKNLTKVLTVLIVIGLFSTTASASRYTYTSGSSTMHVIKCNSVKNGILLAYVNISLAKSEYEGKCERSWINILRGKVLSKKSGYLYSAVIEKYGFKDGFKKLKLYFDVVGTEENYNDVILYLSNVRWGRIQSRAKKFAKKDNLVKFLEVAVKKSYDQLFW